mgnify:CR=1 FL=1
MNINERVKIVRKTRQFTQQAVATHLNLSVSSYNMKEKGKRPIFTEELVAIADLFGINITLFFDKEFHETCIPEMKVVS